jgi:hypothetical protein
MAAPRHSHRWSSHQTLHLTAKPRQD